MKKIIIWIQNKLPCLEGLSQLLKSLVSCGPLLPEIGRKRETTVPAILELKLESWLRTETTVFVFQEVFGGNLLIVDNSVNLYPSYELVSKSKSNIAQASFSKSPQPEPGTTGAHPLC